MLFNSIDFALFFPLVFLAYWFFEDRAKQNIVLLVSSCVFYGWWDYRFLALLAFSILLDYVMGLKIDAAGSAPAKKLLLSISVLANLGFLGFFKYHNFFAESLNAALRAAGLHPGFRTLDLILPVGISLLHFSRPFLRLRHIPKKDKADDQPVGLFDLRRFLSAPGGGPHRARRPPAAASPKPAPIRAPRSGRRIAADLVGGF